MNILLTNDDGYQSVGLQLLCQELSRLPNTNIYVVAPDSQRSGYSHALKFHEYISFTKLDEYYGAKEAYITEGTPANCSNWAINMLNVTFDLVISGPNAGPNYGYDVMYSGTIGGAEEAVIKGTKAVAVSLNSFNGDFTNTVNFVVKNLDNIYNYTFPQTLLNINVPDTDDIKGVVVVPQCNLSIFDDYYVEKEGKYSLEGHFKVPDYKGSDVYMCNHGYITLSPLKVMRNCDEAMDIVRRAFDL